MAVEALDCFYVLTVLHLLMGRGSTQNFPEARQPCSTETDILLLPDASAQNRDSFLQCYAFPNSLGGTSGTGIWRSVPCPSGLQFAFEQQRCLSPQDQQSVGINSASATDNFAIPGEEVFPGESCLGQEICLGGSYCDEGIGVCSCPQGTSDLNGECIRTLVIARIGESCSANWQCTGGSVCQVGECACPAPLQKAGNQCAKPVAVKTESWPGEPCLNGEECLGGSSCDRTYKVCTCAYGMEVFEKTCRFAQDTEQQQQHQQDKQQQEHENQKQRQQLLQLQQQQQQQQQQLQVQQQREEQQQSAGFWEPTQVGQQTSSEQVMVLAAGPMSSCAAGEVCTGDSVCQAGICTCPPMSILAGQTCVRPHSVSSIERVTPPLVNVNPVVVAPVPTAVSSATSSQSVGVGQGCTTNLDCSIGAFCRTLSGTNYHACACLSTHVAVNEQCYRIIYPGQSGCLSDFQCAAAFDGAKCEDGSCKCPPGTTSMSQTCRPDQTQLLAANPGESCSQSQKCTGGSACIQGLCSCPDPSMTISNSQCKKKKSEQRKQVDVGSICDIDKLCGEGAACIQGVCVCYQGYEKQGDLCIYSGSRDAYPLASCRNGEVCSGGSFCDGSICKCPDGTKVSGIECTPIAVPPFAKCDRGELCSGGSICDGSICQCQNGYAAVGGVCKIQKETLEDSPIGGACGARRRCGGGSRCMGGICICPEGTRSTDQGICQFVQSSPINGQCSETQICDGGSFCGLAGFCECPEGTVQQDKQCIAQQSAIPKEIPAGSACGPTDSCTGGSYCAQGFCICPAGTQNKDGLCMQRTHVPNQNAMVRRPESAVQPSPQLKPVVASLPGPVHKISKTRQRNASPGGSCAEGQRCRGGSYCTEGRCVCPSGTVPSERGCKRRAEAEAEEAIKVQAATSAPCPLPAHPEKCKLPHCFCSATGTEIPSGLQPKQTPQLVVLTFDDAVNGKNIDVYKRLFDGRYKNPNGCPIKATFFVSHEWTNYDEVQWLSYMGHELSSNSITHTNLRDKSYEDWAHEMDGLRSIMSKYANIATSEITGMRTPQLALGGDDMFKMMKQFGFKYDNSMTANPGQDSPPFWPQTVDYQLPWECQNNQCPKGSHPGVWEVPINQFYGYFLEDINAFKRGSMLAAALSTKETQASIIDLLRKNFIRAYENNRAPYVLTLNAGFINALDDGGALLALEQWLEEVVGQPDVWVVTMKELIQWMQNPIPLDRMMTVPLLDCKRTKPATKKPCRAGNKCLYKTPELITGEHLFKTCNACPRRYPWIGNPDGT